MIALDLRSNIKAFERKVSAFAFKQLPFATAQALNAIAKTVVKAEQLNEVKVLDRPTQFTTGGIGVKRANKASQTVEVFMKDATAKYLEPYEFGGLNVLNGRALLKPIGAVSDLNAYGNLPRGYIAKLKGRSDIFVGKMPTKLGPVNGVWQRVTNAGAPVTVTTINKKTHVVRVRRTRKNLNTSTRLKLLVKFTDAHVVRQKLDWFGVAGQVVAKEFDRELGRQLAIAIATAK